MTWLPLIWAVLGALAAFLRDRERARLVAEVERATEARIAAKANAEAAEARQRSEAIRDRTADETASTLDAGTF